MAVVALSPWPKTPGALASAAMAGRKHSAEQFAASAARLGPVAALLVERYAPGAPQPVKDEAVILCAAWIDERGSGAAQSVSESIGGPVSVSENMRISPGQLGALRYSGGMSLLSPWKQRRAGKIA